MGKTPFDFLKKGLFSAGHTSCRTQAGADNPAEIKMSVLKVLFDDATAVSGMIAAAAETSGGAQAYCEDEDETDCAVMESTHVNNLSLGVFILQ